MEHKKRGTFFLRNFEGLATRETDDAACAFQRNEPSYDALVTVESSLYCPTFRYSPFAGISLDKISRGQLGGKEVKIVLLSGWKRDTHRFTRLLHASAALTRVSQPKRMFQT